MRLSEVSRARGELPADGQAAGDRGRPVTVQADQPGLTARPGPDRPGRDQPDGSGSRSLAERLARLPDAHPSACSGAAERFPADWAGARTGGEPAGEDTWWRGESDIWWRIPDGPADEADCDDDDDPGGLSERGELADSGDLAGADAPAEADPAAGADVTGETGDQRGGTGGRAARGAAPAGLAGPDHGTRDGRLGGAGRAGPDQSGPDRGHYEPWFSADASGDPWFAAGLAYWAGS